MVEELDPEFTGALLSLLDGVVMDVESDPDVLDPGLVDDLPL